MNMDVSIGNAVTIRDEGEGVRSVLPRVLAVVDQFEILKSLGTGGFGTVYLAHDKDSDIEVALKVVGKDRKAAFCSFGWDDGTTRKDEGSKGLEEELRKNFKLIHGLKHDNIVAVHPLHLVKDVQKYDKSVSIAHGDILSVLEYAPGVTLDKWRQMFEGDRVPIRLAMDIIRQIASALDYAHANGVIHRDIKPSNVMVDTREGCKPVVRLLDFGLAATADGGRGMCGTPQYMSPEQWGGGHQDVRTDQYSLAVLACELLTGHVPLENVFSCADREVMRIAVMNREPEYPKGLSGKQRQVIEKAMAKAPEERFGSCEAFVVALSGRTRKSIGGFWLLVVLLGALGLAVLLDGRWHKHTSVDPGPEDQSCTNDVSVTQPPAEPSAQPPAEPPSGSHPGGDEMHPGKVVCDVQSAARELARGMTNDVCFKKKYDEAIRAKGVAALPIARFGPMENLTGERRLAMLDLAEDTLKKELYALNFFEPGDGREEADCDFCISGTLRRLNDQDGCPRYKLKIEVDDRRAHALIWEGTQVWTEEVR